MEKKNERVVFIRLNQQVIGVVNSDDLKNRVLAKGIPDNRPISEVMTSPVLSIHSGALLYEAVLGFKSKTVSHLLVKDEGGSVTGVVSNQDCLEVQRNSLSYLIQQINTSETIKQLKELYSQLPTLISALVSSSDNINHITRLITTVSDSISCRVIQLGIDQMGNPPCKFAFIAMGVPASSGGSVFSTRSVFIPAAHFILTAMAQSVDADAMWVSMAWTSPCRSSMSGKQGLGSAVPVLSRLGNICCALLSSMMSSEWEKRNSCVALRFLNRSWECFLIDLPSLGGRRPACLQRPFQ